MNLYYKAWMVFARSCFTLFAKWRVEGRENIPPLGPLLVVSNHLSNADPPLIMASFNRPLHGLAKKSLFTTPIVGFFFKGMGAHPVNRSGVDMVALRWVLKTLERDGAVLMFPEGARSSDATLKQSLPGIGYVALKSQAPIIPIAVTGTEGINNYLRIPFVFRDLTVRIGQPFTLPLVEGRLTRPVLQQYADMIMERVATLLPSQYQGHYQTPMVQDEPRQSLT